LTEGAIPSLFVPLNIDLNPGSPFEAAAEEEVDQVFQGLKGFSPPADEQSRVLSLNLKDRTLRSVLQIDLGGHLHVLQQFIDDGLSNGGNFSVVDGVTAFFVFAHCCSSSSDGASKTAYSNAGRIRTEAKEAWATTAKNLNLYLVSFGVEFL
jgi:hypothetical protein